MKRLLLTATLLLCITSSFALQVIYKGSALIEAEPFLLHEMPATAGQDTDAHAFQLPCKSTLTAGKVESRILDIPNLLVPYFVLSSDSLSLHWLTTNCQLLTQMHALALVTNIDTQIDLERLNETCPMNYLPVDLEGIREDLGVAHYPFLVSRTGIEQ